MSELLTTYFDADYLSFVLDFVNLVPAGLALGVCLWAFGWVVSWFYKMLIRNV